MFFKISLLNFCELLVIKMLDKNDSFLLCY